MNKKLTVRKAELSDTGAIADLLVQRFGELALREGALSYVVGRYYVAVTYSGEIIGVSGIVDDGDYDEISFTCVDKKHEGQKVMSAIFEYMLAEHDDDRLLYLYAWHLESRQYANLHYVALKFGFKLMQSSFKTRYKNITASCKNCIYSNKTHCRCHEDLYVRNVRLSSCHE